MIAYRERTCRLLFETPDIDHPICRDHPSAHLYEGLNASFGYKYTGNCQHFIHAFGAFLITARDNRGGLLRVSEIYDVPTDFPTTEFAFPLYPRLAATRPLQWIIDTESIIPTGEQDFAEFLYGRKYFSETPFASIFPRDGVNSVREI